MTDPVTITVRLDYLRVFVWHALRDGYAVNPQTSRVGPDAVWADFAHMRDEVVRYLTVSPCLDAMETDK